MSGSGKQSGNRVAGGRARGSGAPEHTAPDRIRNVVLVGTAGAGKTTLVEAALLASSATTRLGRVEDGTTVCDHEDVEHRLGRSVSLAVASVTVDPDPGVPTSRDVGKTTITFIDTPGHADFVGEVRAGLRAADAALFVISAVDGIDGPTRMLWHECAEVGMPRAVVITHLDHQRGDFTGTLAQAKDVFGEGVQPLFWPVDGPDGAPRGLFGLLTQTVREEGAVREADEPERDRHEEARGALIEGIIQESEDDTLLDRWLSGEPVGEDTLVADLEKAVVRGSFYPVLPVVPTAGTGVPELLTILARGFPSPLEHPLPPVTDPDGAELPALACDPDGPLVAEVVKTTSDPYVGRISLVRVFSGTLRPDDAVHVCGHRSRFARVVHTGDEEHDHDVDERVGAVSAVFGAQLSPVEFATAGDVVAVARLSRAETGDTLSDVVHPALMRPWSIPEPLLPVAVTARTSSDEDKLSQALTRLAAEDPTTRVEMNPETRQVVVWAMGESHLDVLLERLRVRHGVEVDTLPVRVALRETLSASGAGHGRHVKQSGGHGQYAVCDIEVEPLPGGSGFEFVDKVVGGSVPRQFIPSVEKGVRTQLDRGVAAGYPMVDVRVTLTGGKAHSVDSSDAAFQTAGALALKEAAGAAGVSMLEPVDEVRILVDDEYVGAVMSDLSSRRGRLTGTHSPEPGRTEITAEVPEVELLRYAVDLRGLAHGTGVFTRDYLHHSPVPAHQVERLTAAAP